jgi:hypothetical protein
MKSLQFAQLWLPFGALRYPTEAFDIFAAAARFAFARMIGEATTALVAPCKTERRETFTDQIVLLSPILLPAQFPPWAVYR